MAYTRHSKRPKHPKRPPRNTASMQRTLRREVPSTVGLLADE